MTGSTSADREYDSRAFVRGCRDLEVTPHVARKRRSAIDGRTTRHEGYRLSQGARKRIEEIFGWMKTVGAGHKLRYCGVDRNRMWTALAQAIRDAHRSTWGDTRHSRPRFSLVRHPYN